MMHRRETAGLGAAILIAGCLAALGCGRSGPQMKVVHGTVLCGGQKVETGSVRFVPIEGTRGPASTATIIDGQYRIDARGGVPIGTHRVEVDARRRTGRKVPSPGGPEGMMIDETLPVGDQKHGGRNSPLIVEVAAASEGRLDIEVPAP